MQTQVSEIFGLDENIQLAAMGSITLYISCSPM